MENETKDIMKKEAVIRSLGVFELRGLARELGVPSPTTKKREELIALISEKIKEGHVPETLGQRRGRPFKKLNSLNEIVNGMVSENKKLLDNRNYDNIVNFMQEAKPIIFDCGERIDNFEGFIRCQEDNLYFIDFHSHEKVYIDKQTEGYDLLSIGALVKAQAREISGSNDFWSHTIIEINGQPIDEFTQVEIDKGKEIINNDSIPFGKSEAKVGRRNVFSFKEDLYENDDFENLCEYCKTSDYKLLVFSLNTSFENQILFRNLNMDEPFVTEYGTNPKVSFDKIVDLINYTMYLVERGEKVIVFIPDILEVARTVETLFVSSEPKNLGYAQETVMVMQKLLGLGRAYEQGCSGTLIMGYNEENKDDKLLNLDILRISKKLN